MNSPTCSQCDCIDGCSANLSLCPILVAECIASSQVSAAQHRVLDAAIVQPEQLNDFTLVPAGWQLVPVEPSDAMLTAGKRETHGNRGALEKTKRIYAEMLRTVSLQNVQREQASPRGTDAQILKEREITTSAIVGAMAYGYQNGEYPPEDAAWLRPFWELGRRDAEREVLIAQPEQPAGDWISEKGVRLLMRTEYDRGYRQCKYDSMDAIAQPEQPAAWHPTGTAITALKRFEETCSDDEGYDVPKDTMRNLAAIGLIYRTYGDMYCITDFGQHVLATNIAQPKDKS